MKGKLLETTDTIVGIAQCSNGNLGIVIKMEPNASDKVDLKFYGIDGTQYKVIPFEMALQLEGEAFKDSNDNEWKVISLK